MNDLIIEKAGDDDKLSCIITIYLVAHKQTRVTQPNFTKEKIYPRAVKKYERFKLKSHFSESLKAPDYKGLQKTNGDHVLRA